MLALCASACAPMPPLTPLPPCPGGAGRAPGWADYFPERTFDVKPDFHNDLKLKWYGGALAAMCEPVLSRPRPGGAEVYRVLVASSWRDDRAVRVERTEGGAELQATTLAYAEGTTFDRRPKKRGARRLSPGEWQRVTDAFRAADFWALPSPEPPRGFDGEMWVVEALGPRGYNAVERWEPRWDDPARAAGGALLELAGLREVAAIPEPKLVKPVNPEDLGP
jgi:hypothetical protein